jgi:glycogen debranching enzyme
MSVLRLHLNAAGSVDPGVIRIPHPNVTLQVHVSVGTPFHGPDTVLLTNHPISSACDEATITSQKSYSLMEDLLFDIPITTPGAWRFRLFRGNRDGISIGFIVDPLIDINGRPVPIGALSIQTNLGRCIGYVQAWLVNLKPVSELGYNMIHLPSFQENGRGSHYSIRDAHQVSSELFPDGFPVSDRWPLLKAQMKQVESELGLVFMSDIVLNHLSPHSDFLKIHPEAAYNPINSPHLAPAYYVDTILAELSNAVADGLAAKVPPELPCDKIDDLDKYLFNGLHNSDLSKYFTIDVEKTVNELREHSDGLPKDFEMLRMRAVNYGAPERHIYILRRRAIIDDKQYKFGSISVDLNYACALYKSTGSFTAVHEEVFRMALNTLNTLYVKNYNSIVRENVTNVVNALKRSHGNRHSKRFSAITRECPIAW